MVDRRITTGGEGEEQFPKQRPGSLPPRMDPYDQPEDDRPTLRFPRRVFEQDRQYLGLLVIFHFVLAGLAFFGGICPLFGLGMGIWMLSGAFPTGPAGPPGASPGPPPGPPMELMGWIMVGEYGLMFVALCGAGTLACLVGYFLKRRRRWLFCIIGSGIQCLFVPFGTILGIFTIIVLARESVRHVFQYGEPVMTDDEDYQ
jgi:hypothetical protein